MNTNVLLMLISEREMGRKDQHESGERSEAALRSRGCGLQRRKRGGGVAEKVSTPSVREWFQRKRS